MKPIFQISIFALFSMAASLAAADTITGKVVAVADGDTITVLQDETQIKVRFHGVDCPESKQDFGTAAKEFTAERCFGEVVTVVVTDTDRYSRKVGLVILKDGRVLNHELVAAGLAHWYAEYAPHDDALKRLQEEAKAAKRGLWSRADAIAPSEFRKDKAAERAAPYNPPSAIRAEPGPAAAAGASAGNSVVYITDTGAKYHREGCRSLSASKQAIPLEEARKRYAPCGICRP